ncbi:MAG: cysteinyl-tRNA synthetase [Actinomycetota bacterium]
MYVCGPTVYDVPHLGHGRFSLVFDILRRYLLFRGLDVTYVSNVTDIDDNIINRAARDGVPWEEIVTTYEAKWWEAMDGLGVMRPTHDPHATAYVDEMIAMIKALFDKGVAYVIEGDGVYLRTDQVPDYGLLAGQSLESLQAGARVEANADKQNPADFALWKFAKPGEPLWESPWGDGRPGWHTECVVMSLDLLGEGFDLHGGGRDLAFPHHENERAQSVALGKAFARHWMHNGWVEVEGVKMSKSLDNFTSLTDLLDQTGDGRTYRLLVLRAHYRSPTEVTAETIRDAAASLERLDAFGRRFAPARRAEPDAAAIERFVAHMDDDLDTPAAVADVFDLVRAANAAADAHDNRAATRAAAAAFAITDALGLVLRTDEDDVDEPTAELIAARNLARSEKNWGEADRLRDELTALGWTVKDGPEGTTVHR